MGRTVIVSEETIRSLVTANAALAAWYHEHVRAAREQTPVVTPSEGTRTAFLQRIADELPEIASVVRAIGPCPIVVPPPLAFAPRASQVELGAQAISPPAVVAPPPGQSMPQSTGAVSGAPSLGAPSVGAERPPLVNPREVKY